MQEALSYVSVVMASVAAIAAILTLIVISVNRRGSAAADLNQLSSLLRTETDRQRQAVEDQSRASREELAGAIRGFQDATLKAFRELGDGLGSRISEFGTRLDAGLMAMGSKLDQDIRQMGDEASKNREVFRQSIEAKLDDAAAKHIGAIKESFAVLSQHQTERLDAVVASLNMLWERHVKAQEALHLAVDGKLDAIRSENTNKLEEIRKTVDDQLQSTLNERITSSFKMVHDQLEQVHKGVGEMRQLADGVGDLKRMLTNVKTRGVFGEVQLGSLIEQM